MRLRFRWICLLICLSALFQALSQAQEPEIAKVRVENAFIDLYTGPGRGYPKFHIAEKGEWLTLLKSETQWYRVENERGIKGWASMEDLENTSNIHGQPTQINQFSQESFLKRRLELGVSGGLFNDDNMVSTSFGMRFTPYFSGDLRFSDISGNFSNSSLVSVNLKAHPFYQQRWSPYFGMGIGYFENEPKTSLVGTNDSSAQSASVALGINYYLNRRFIWHLELGNHLIFLNGNETDSHQSISTGFSVFYGGDNQSGWLDNGEGIPKVDSDNLEVSLYYGAYSVEDFGAAPSSGFRLSYFINEDLFFDASFGQMTIYDQSFRDKGLPLFQDGEESLRYYHVGLGYNILPGEITYSNGFALPTRLYVLAGLGSTDFAEREWFTTTIGAGLRISPWNWLGLKLEVFDHIYESDLLSDSKFTHNPEITVGISYVF